MAKLFRFFAKASRLGIYHRDIKPDNFFIMSDGRIKIGDFGAAKVGEQADATKTIKGTLAYISPAKVTGMNNPDGRVHEDTGKGDVWSLGTTFLYMINLEKPMGINNRSMARKVLMYLLKSTQYCDLIRYTIFWMLQHDEDKRWSFEQLNSVFEKFQIPDF
jgi:serine/threonine protein kinase